jgi:hypothetical protein
MFLVVNAKGQYWTGFEWGQQGKPFLTVAAAARSLHEEGEDLNEAELMEVQRDSP